MKLRELMTTDVITIGPEASVKGAARRMIEAGVSGLPVTDESGSLVGVITEADFVKSEAGRRAAKRARLLSWFTRDTEIPDTERKVGDVMTPDVTTLGPDVDHAEAARVMKKAGIKRIPVVDEGGELIGLVSRSDILRAFARSDGDIVAEIRDHLMRKVLWIDPRLVDIVCEDGNLVLTGNLETRSDATLLVDLTGRLDGVVSVKDRLTWTVDNTKVEMVASPRPVVPNW
jgi:CBS-domain-containing membrane protein